MRTIYPRKYIFYICIMCACLCMCKYTQEFHTKKIRRTYWYLQGTRVCPRPEPRAKSDTKSFGCFFWGAPSLDEVKHVKALTKPLVFFFSDFFLLSLERLLHRECSRQQHNTSSGLLASKIK